MYHLGVSIDKDFKFKPTHTCSHQINTCDELPRNMFDVCLVSLFLLLSALNHVDLTSMSETRCYNLATVLHNHQLDSKLFLDVWFDVSLNNFDVIYFTSILNCSGVICSHGVNKRVDCFMDRTFFNLLPECIDVVVEFVSFQLSSGNTLLCSSSSTTSRINVCSHMHKFVAITCLKPKCASPWNFTISTCRINRILFTGWTTYYICWHYMRVIKLNTYLLTYLYTYVIAMTTSSTFVGGNNCKDWGKMVGLRGVTPWTMNWEFKYI